MLNYFIEIKKIMKNLFFISLISLSIVFFSCEKENIDPIDENNNQEDTTGNTENPVIEKYLILLESNDTVPLFTSSVNYSDTLRHIFQVNFKDDEFNYSFVITYKAEPTESFEYTTTDDRSFFGQDGASDKVNIYVTNFGNGKNYHVEPGKTFTYSVSDTEYSYEFSNIIFTEEVEGTETFTASVKVVHELN